MRGRFCFSGGPKFKEIEAFVRNGAVMKATQITTVFTVEDFRATYEDAMILFKHDPEKGLSPIESDIEEIQLVGPLTIYALVKGKEAA